MLTRVSRVGAIGALPEHGRFETSGKEESTVETYLEESAAVGAATDPVTGLPMLSLLVERIQQLQEAARAARGPRRSVLADHILLVVSIASLDDRHEVLFLRARTASLLRSLFAQGETIALLRQGLFGVLVRDRPDFATDRLFLEALLSDFDVEARVWTERLPTDGPGTANLLSSLLLGGEWPSSLR